MSKYWEKEQPIVLSTSKNTISFYPNAEKLIVALPVWIDKFGDERFGKQVAFNIGALLESGVDSMVTAREVFEKIITRIDEKLEQM